MFEAIRSHRKILFSLMILLIIPSFVFFGIEGYSRFRDGAQPVASVAGQNITMQEFDAAHRRNTDRMRQFMGERFDAKFADTPEAKKATIDELVREKVLAEAVKDRHLTVSDQTVKDTILQDPAVAALKKPDGSFDLDAYRNLLAAQGLSPEGYDARVRQYLVSTQVLQGVGNTSVVAASQSNQVFGLRNERREVQVLTVKSADLSAQLSPTEADLDAYYKANSSRYQAPEMAAIEYLVLDTKALQEQLVVNLDDVKTYYDQNKDRYKVDERRRASHILLMANKTDKADVKAAAKAKAEQLLLEVKKNPGAFAELAKKNSQDPGSGEKGGDLDFFGRGAMVKPFDEAVFSMKEGDISAVVESDFGFHIIKLTSIQAATVKTFEEVKADIEADLKRQQAGKKFAEVAEQFSNAVYEQSDTFKAIAEKLKITVQTAANATRQANRSVPPVNPLGNEKFLQALFSEDSIKNKRNTAAIELGANVLASGRLVSYTAAAVRPFADVKESVRAGWVAQEAQKRAKTQGEEKLKAALAKADSVAFEPSLTVGRNGGPQFHAIAAAAAFKADSTKLPQIIGVEVNGIGYLVVKVNKLLPPESTDEAQKAQEAQRLAAAWANAESALYLDALKKRYKSEIKPSADTGTAAKDAAGGDKPKDAKTAAS